MSDKPPSVFVSYSREDSELATKISDYLGKQGFPVWLDRDSISAGEDWGSEVKKAIEGAAVFLPLISSASTRSASAAGELSHAVKNKVAVLPIKVEDTQLPSDVAHLQALDLTDTADPQSPEALKLVDTQLRQFIPPADPSQLPGPKPATSPARGYVFVSYVHHDRSFVTKLTALFKERGYAYWEYKASVRDYHSALWRELEERIENAKAFISVVSDSWRETEWMAAEFIYAREAMVPIFVVQARRLERPLPIILNQQTRIDMSKDFAEGAATLERELDKKNL